MRAAARRLLTAALLSGFASSSSTAQEDTPAQTEQKAAFRAIRPAAGHCAGDVACFKAHVRPYGPWVVAIGGRQGEADPALASEVTNFAFGVVGGMAGVDPSAISAGFFCGESCMKKRMTDLARDAGNLASVGGAFSRSSLSLVALWPNDRIRADDCVISASTVRCPGRTPELGLFQGWIEGATENPRPVPAEQARSIAAMLRTRNLVAAVRDEGGGVRLVHGDSLAENEVGLLFAASPPPQGVRHRDGSRYTVVERVAPGVYAYLRV